MARIDTYDDLTEVVEEYGFLPFSGDTKKSLFTLGNLTDNQWHTDDEGTDPWKWRMRAASEGKTAYGKFFHKKSGFIAPRCIPAFIAVRRDNKSFAELYEEGLVSRKAKQVFDCFDWRIDWTFQQLRMEAGFGTGASRDFEAAMVELQMLFLINISGQSQRINKMGQPYGWASNDFGLLEAAFPVDDDERMQRDQGEQYLLDCIRKVGDFPEKMALSLLRSGSV